jgi:hypothetical protein
LILWLVAPTGECQLFDNLEAFAERPGVGDPETGAVDGNEGPKGIAAADFNGDGQIDLAVSNLDGTVTVFNGTASGQFERSHDLKTGARSLRGIIAEDFNNDQRSDIATAAPFDGQVFLFISRGDAGFSEAVELAAWEGARNLIGGDFDGDGNRDLAVAGPIIGLRHYGGRGDGTFEALGDLQGLASTEASENFAKPVYSLTTIPSSDGKRDDVVLIHAESDRYWILGTQQNVTAFAVPAGLQKKPNGASSSELVITELILESVDGLADEDGIASPWVEVFNNSDADINLGGWTLDLGNKEWEFPDRTLQAGHHLVVFVSGKNRDGAQGNLHTDFSFGADAELTLKLERPSGALVQTIRLAAELLPPADISYGVNLDGDYVYFELPSPGTINNAGTPNLEDLLKLPIFNSSRSSPATMIPSELP